MSTALGFLVLIALVALAVRQLDRTARRHDAFAAPPGADLRYDRDVERVRAEAAMTGLAHRTAPTALDARAAQSRRAGLHGVGRHGAGRHGTGHHEAGRHLPHAA